MRHHVDPHADLPRCQAAVSSWPHRRSLHRRVGAVPGDGRCRRPTEGLGSAPPVPSPAPVLHVQHRHVHGRESTRPAGRRLRPQDPDLEGRLGPEAGVAVHGPFTRHPPNLRRPHLASLLPFRRRLGPRDGRGRVHAACARRGRAEFRQLRGQSFRQCQGAPGGRGAGPLGQAATRYDHSGSRYGGACSQGAGGSGQGTRGVAGGGEPPGPGDAEKESGRTHQDEGQKPTEPPSQEEANEYH
mmetsp:Transcript_30165/g.55119  ORF Transcript_30165/g.55119 Transcript_30165/m.55119 type:complete len:242 (+) Transcript_30165:813-1538(+)